MMSPLSSTTDGHLSNSLLVQFIDDELSPEEATATENHLAHCSSCTQRFAELRRVSSSFDRFVESLCPAFDISERQELVSKLDSVNGSHSSRSAPKPLRTLGWWGLAAAAALAVGVLYLPQTVLPGNRMVGVAPAIKEVASAAFEIDGETFVSLPFSNPELPVNARRIVQMQVPVSSLAEAGIIVEPVANRVAQPDQSVLADVLLGLDGQPVAVHVVSFD